MAQWYARAHAGPPPRDGLLLLAPTAAQANFPGEIDGPPRAAFPDYSADGRTLAFVREAA